MSWEYKHIYSESNTSHNFKVDFMHIEGGKYSLTPQAQKGSTSQSWKN